MTKEVQNYQEKPGILVAIDADELAHALKQLREGYPHSVFGANVKKVFSGFTANDEIKLLIRMNHTALTPGEEAVVDYIGTLDTVWLDPPDKINKEFKTRFEEIFKAPWNELKPFNKNNEPMAIYYSVKDIRYLRAPIRISELRNWSDREYFLPNYRIKRPTRVLWEPDFLERIGA